MYAETTAWAWEPPVSIPSDPSASMASMIASARCRPMPVMMLAASRGRPASKTPSSHPCLMMASSRGVVVRIDSCDSFCRSRALFSSRHSRMMVVTAVVCSVFQAVDMSRYARSLSIAARFGSSTTDPSACEALSLIASTIPSSSACLEPK